MPRFIRGPFSELAKLPYLDIDAAFEVGAENELIDAVGDRMQLLHDVLEGQGLNCNGHAVGRQRDEYWGGDISELICRSAPHEINRLGPEGVIITEVVSVRLDTLTVEIDSNNEVCCWVYEES